MRARYTTCGGGGGLSGGSVGAPPSSAITFMPWANACDCERDGASRGLQLCVHLIGYRILHLLERRERGVTGPLPWHGRAELLYSSAGEFFSAPPCAPAEPAVLGPSRAELRAAELTALAALEPQLCALLQLAALVGDRAADDPDAHLATEASASLKRSITQLQRLAGVSSPSGSLRGGAVGAFRRSTRDASAIRAERESAAPLVGLQTPREHLEWLLQTLQTHPLPPPLVP